jgi:hypothetical protein
VQSRRFPKLGKLGWVWKSRQDPRQCARLDLEVSAGWASLSFRGLWGGDALLLTTGRETETLAHEDPAEGWRGRCKEGKRPATVPYNPQRTYADAGWLSWADWLGTKPGAIARCRGGKDFLPFEEARQLVRGAGLHSQMVRLPNAASPLCATPTLPNGETPERRFISVCNSHPAKW